MDERQPVQFSLTQIFILTAAIGAVLSVLKPPSLIPVVLLAVLYALATLLLWTGLMLFGRLIILAVGALANASIGLRRRGGRR
ncbi:MAG: hypothetical protein WD278_20460 [Pirellulales bacterium]